MDDAARTSSNFRLIDLTNDDASSSNRKAPCIDLTGIDDHSPELIDLTDDDNQHFNSNIPVIDLTGDNYQLLNNRIPVIDLTNDDAQDVSYETQCIDLTKNEASSSNHIIRNFDLGGIDDRETNRNTKLIDLAHDDIQYFNSFTPVIDSTCDDEQYLINRIQDIDMTDGDVHDITDRLQSFDLVDGKQQNINDRPTIDLTNLNYQSMNRIIPVDDLTCDKDCTNDRMTVIDLKRNEDRVLRIPAEDAEMYDLSCNNLLSSIQTGVIEKNVRTPSANINYNSNENDVLKYSGTSNMNERCNDTFSNRQKIYRRKEILENHPLKKNFEIRNDTFLTNHPLSHNSESRKETILRNRSLRNNFEDRIETIFANHPLINHSEEKYLSPEKPDKISQNNTSDFLKPAHRPIPLRHSLGRSIVNTSKNVPFEYIEGSEGQPRTMTVSSVIRRKKSKSSDIYAHNSPKSKIPSTSRENTFETFKGFFRKFWIILLFTFIGLYYWI